MITRTQISSLARHFQIDDFTVAREYLQVLFLSYLYQDRESDKIYFKGGTALRLLFGSSRFSEDLDFSTLLTRAEVIRILKRIEKSLGKELPTIKIFPLYTGRGGYRFRLKYQAEDFKYPLVIRLDFNQVKKVNKTVVSPLVTKFPIAVFPLIIHLSEEEIAAEKLCALLTRGKGRDFFDVWFLLAKGVVVEKKLLKDKLSERGEKYNVDKILKKIRSYSLDRLKLDLMKFLPKSQRKIIGILKESLRKKLMYYF